LTYRPWRPYWPDVSEDGRETSGLGSKDQVCLGHSLLSCSLCCNCDGGVPLEGKGDNSTAADALHIPPALGLWQLAALSLPSPMWFRAKTQRATWKARKKVACRQCSRRHPQSALVGKGWQPMGNGPKHTAISLNCSRHCYPRKGLASASTFSAPAAVAHPSRPFA
jgi:hypothetical protein